MFYLYDKVGVFRRMWYENIEKGYFKPKNPHKYVGDSAHIVWRSSWEKKVMKYLDENKNVLSWSSEEECIIYRSPIDSKLHRYFPDFVARIKTPDGKEKTVMIEVKPEKYTVAPSRTKGKRRSTYLHEVSTWGVNQAKWEAAREIAKDKGWEFIIMTEKHLGIRTK